MSGSRDPTVDLPLTYAQETIWFLDQLEPGSSAYSIQSVQRLKGPLHVAAVRAAVAQLFERHEALRTCFPARAGQPYQVVYPAPLEPCGFESLASIPASDRESALRCRLQELASQPRWLESEGLFIPRLVQLGPEDHVLGFFTHHIVVDGASLALLWEEFIRCYDAQCRTVSAPLLPPSTQPTLHARWERQYWNEARLKTTLAFWKEQLAPPISSLELPMDHARSASQLSPGGRVEFQIPQALLSQFKQFCHAERSTSFIGWLALFNLLLHRYTRQDDVGVGCASSSRHRPELESAVGMFTNLVPHRVDAGGDPSFREFLRRVRSVALEVRDAHEIPFELLVQHLSPARRPGRNPFFDAAFTYLHGTPPAVGLPGLSVEPVDCQSTGSKFDILLGVQETADDAWASFEFRADLFQPSTMARLGRVFVQLMRAVVESPDRRLSAYPLADESDRREALRRAGGGRRATPPRAVLESIWDHVAAQPDRVALVSDGEKLSYGEMGRRILSIADELQKASVGRDQVVALLMDRSADWVCALLGVWEAGAAFMPLDPEGPLERSQFMLTESRAQVVITHERWRHRLPQTSARPLVLPLPPRSGIVARRRESLAHDSLAYVIYTSGSTGKPKGVMIEQGHLANYVASVIETLELPAGGSFAMISTVAADLGMTVLFPGLALGGTLHLLSPELAGNGAALERYQAKHELQVLKIVPSHLAALRIPSRPGSVLPTSRLVFGGDVLPADLAGELKRVRPSLKICNHYGPTETTVGAIAWQIPDEGWAPSSMGHVPLGRPLPHARVYVVDEQLQIQPIGVPGEICLGGAGVGRGYWAQPDLTSQKFIADPYVPGGRMYRTGDVGRIREDGLVEFLGRADQQVKVRGFRVELMEIEAVLKQHPAVKEVAVILKGSLQELVAYVVPLDARAAALCEGQIATLANGLRVAHLNRNETQYIYREIFELQAYVQHGITIRDEAAVLDIGANIGLFSVFANLVAREPRVFAFEPNPAVYAALVRNARAYGPHTRAIAAGVSNRSGSAEFTFFQGFSLLSGFYADAKVEREVVKQYVMNLQAGGDPNGSRQRRLEREIDELLEGRFEASTVSAPLLTVSQFMAQEGLELVDLLKVNVEKSERDVLDGIEDRDWPKIRQCVVEVDLKEHAEPIVLLLERHGFEVVVEQDPLLRATELCYVYAIRPGPLGRLNREVAGGRETLPVRTVDLDWPEPEDLRRTAMQRLPGPMVPRRYVFLEQLPLTRNGKVDRDQLPERGATHQIRDEVEPRNDQERVIQKIWCEVLGIAEAGIHTDFFELGGHSLTATQVVSRLSDAFQLHLPLRTFFESPTVSGLGEAVERILLAEIAGMDDDDAARRAGQLDTT